MMVCKFGLWIMMIYGVFVFLLSRDFLVVGGGAKVLVDALVMMGGEKWFEKYTYMYIWVV